MHKDTRFKLTLGVFTLALATLLAAQPPAWWSNSANPVIDPNVTTTGVDQNYAPANLGQLKFFAKQAKLHLDANLYGGSGSTITSLVNGFTPQQGVSYTQAELDALRAANYAPINLGQLKAVAKPFYDRLNVAGYSTKANLIARGYPVSWPYDYPWNPTTPMTDNYAPANIGQLKLVFSFDLAGFDSDQDGMPDSWELAHGFSPTDSSDGGGNADADGDGISNFDEYQQGSNPNDFFNDQLPILTIVGGNSQGDTPGETLARPLSVKLTNSRGTPKANVAIEFTIVSGGGTLSLINGGQTNQHGIAEAQLTLPAAAGAVISTRATFGISQVSFSSSVGNSAEAPAAPSEIQCTRENDSQILISWTDNANNETAYFIQRSLDNATWTPIATLSKNSTSFTDNEAPPASQDPVIYKIVAHNEAP